jgi:hypothetical protein
MRKEFVTAPKVSSPEKSELNAMLLNIEQLRGLPKSFVVVRSVFSLACRSGLESPNCWPSLVCIQVDLGT